MPKGKRYALVAYTREWDCPEPAAWLRAGGEWVQDESLALRLTLGVAMAKLKFWERKDPRYRIEVQEVRDADAAGR